MLAHRLRITNPQDYGLYCLKSQSGAGVLTVFATLSTKVSRIYTFHHRPLVLLDRNLQQTVVKYFEF